MDKKPLSPQEANFERIKESAASIQDEQSKARDAKTARLKELRLKQENHLARVAAKSKRSTTKPKA